MEISKEILSITKEYDDWRLPTAKELSSLVNYNKSNPASDLEDTTDEPYWTSTKHIDYFDRFWYVFFDHGRVGFFLRTYTCYVRCVRDGERGLEWSKSSEDVMTWDEAKTYVENYKGCVYYIEERELKSPPIENKKVLLICPKCGSGKIERKIIGTEIETVCIECGYFNDTSTFMYCGTKFK